MLLYVADLQIHNLPQAQLDSDLSVHSNYSPPNYIVTSHNFCIFR